MLKKYQAKSHLSLSVLLEKGTSVHIAFSALTGGGSVYYTDDEEVQRALERHLKYGKLFRCVASGIEEKEKPPTAPEKLSDGNGRTDGVEETETSVEESGLKKIAVACMDDAREYLAGTFGISRSKMRSAAAIKELATAHHIEFSGI